VVVVSDLEAKLGRQLTGADRARAESDLDDAYALASAAGLLSDPETAAQRAVIKRVALRAFGSPDGVRVITQETIGSRSVSYSDNRGVSSGVFFTAEDRAAMRGRPISGAYSVPLTTPSDHLP
jgi:hypothetical protein